MVGSMLEYTFTLKYRLPYGVTDVDAILDRLGRAGCNDALVGIGTYGRIALAFTRTAGSLEEAFHSAFRDVKAAIPSAILVDVIHDVSAPVEVTVPA